MAGSSIREAGGDVWQSEMVDGVGDSDFKTETYKNKSENADDFCTFESRIISESRGACGGHSIQHHLIND